MKDRFELIKPDEFQDRIIKSIGKDWMLITAGKMDHYNTMTAAWGGLGYLWNKPVSYIFVRPQRFTYEFTEQYDRYTLSFFDESFRDKLMYCGRHSGRDVNKAKETGLTAIETANQNIAFEEARLIIECRKLYADDIKQDKFIDPLVDLKMYPENDYHRMYIGEIQSILERK